MEGMCEGNEAVGCTLPLPVVCMEGAKEVMLLDSDCLMAAAMEAALLLTRLSVMCGDELATDVVVIADDECGGRI